MNRKGFLIFFLFIFSSSFAQDDYVYPFQNSGLDSEKRIANILSLMTLDEKVIALSTDLSVLRLGFKGTGHREDLHGLDLGSPAEWGENGKEPLSSTSSPKHYGFGDTWEVDLLSKVAKIEAYTIRFVLQKYNRGSMLLRARDLKY